jgi:hypothetical protein
MLRGNLASAGVALLRTIGLASLTLIATALLFIPSSPASASEGDELRLAVATAQLSADNPSTSILVTNTGSGAVRDVVVSINAPDWANARLISPDDRRVKTVEIGTLRPGAVVLLDLEAVIPIGGRSGGITVRALGSTDVQVAALATVELVKPVPVAAVELAGSTEVADHSPGLVTIVIRNDSEARLPVMLEASGDSLIVYDPGTSVDASQPPPQWRKTIEVDPHQASAVDVEVMPSTPVRPRHVAFVVTARVTTGAEKPTQLIVTRDMTLGISAGGLVPAVTGIGSTLVLPGLGAVLAFLSIREWDRARLGVARRNLAAQMWENKLWLLLALSLSLVAISALRWINGIDLIATPWSWWLLVLASAAAAAGGLAAGIKVALHRLRVPLINSASDVKAVLLAAQKRGGRSRQVHAVTPNLRGVFVHRDYDLIVLAPKTWFSRPGDLSQDGTTLATIAKAVRERPNEFIADFDRMAGWVSRPTPVPRETPWSGEWEELPRYEDRPRG